MPRPKGTGGQAKALTPQEINKISMEFTGVHETRNRALFYWGLGTGMRISEIVNLRWADVAPHGRVLDEVVLEKHGTKGKRSRVVSVSAQAQQYMQHFLKEKGKGEYVFVGSRGALTPKSAGEIIKQAAISAGISNVTSHSLRRTHATWLRRKGVDLKIIQEQLGHRRLTTTAEYLSVDPVEKTEAVKDLYF